MSVKNWLQEQWYSLTSGKTIKIANDGKVVDVITIRYKDLYFFVDLDGETQEPTGTFSWSHDPTMNPLVPIREIWIAKSPKDTK